jgi:LysM repeat protein
MKRIDWRIILILILLAYVVTVLIVWPKDLDISRYRLAWGSTPDAVSPEPSPIVRTLVPTHTATTAPSSTPTPTNTPSPPAANTVAPAHTPTALPSPAVTDQPSPTPTPGVQLVNHVVQRGDNLIALAARYDTTVQAIVKANNLANPDSIWVGQTLVIPSNEAGIPATPGTQLINHTVQRGDNIIALAERYGTTVQAIVEANGLTDSDFIWVGQVLLIPITAEIVPSLTPSP